MSTNPLRAFAIILNVIALFHGAALAQTPIHVPGFLKFEVYTNISGSAVADLTAAASFPDAPARAFYMPSFDTRTVYRDDSHDNYGGRLSGFVTPTEDGEYEFFLRSDDASQLWFSGDDNPANLQLIAEETTSGGPFEETGAPETSQTVGLLAGRCYAIQVLYKEGTGADYAQVAWRKVGDTTPAAQLTPMPIAFLSTLIPPRGNIVVTRHPSSTNTVENEFITLTVEFTATNAPAVVQWQRDGTNVAGLVGGTVRLGPLTVADTGRYRAVISTPGAVTNSLEATVTVGGDLKPPAIRRVVGSDTFDMLTVEFSEAVFPSSSGEAVNYSLSGGLTVSAVEVINSNVVRLTTSPQTPATSYTLTIENIMDTAFNTSTAGTSHVFTTLDRVAGGLKFDVWFGITGNAVASLLSDPRYPRSPDVLAYIRQLTSRLIFPDANSMNDYGGRLSGWIVPPETAEYHFFIRSDDNSQLSLSTDADPANAAIIASEASCCGPFEEPGAPETSAAILLNAGQRYYIEAIWKEGSGGDYCDVAWRKVGDTNTAINLPFIPGAILETYAPPATFTAPTVSIASPVNGSALDPLEPVALTALASAASPKNIAKVDFIQQGRIVGTVSNAPYTLTLYDLREDNHTFIARATDSLGISSDSAPITISVGAQLATATLFAIDPVSRWRYNRSGADLGTDWRQPGFDDTLWPDGTTLIADEGTTTVEPIRTRISRFNDQGTYVQTFYFRTYFNFGAVSAAVKLKLRHVVDDGVVFYLNGEEVHRFGIAEGATFNYLTSFAGHENLYEGPYDIAITNLVEGTNVFAAEVHQSGTSSSDMVFGAELIATFPVSRPNLAITRQGTALRVSWTPGGGVLEAATNPAGPWSPVNGATTPHPVTVESGQRFYRIKM
jgi:hypothetical protein